MSDACPYLILDAIEQLALELEELQASATEDELRAEAAARATGAQQVQGFTRRKPARKPFPEHLPRERIVIPAPAACPCCGSTALAKIGKDVTETLEVASQPSTRSNRSVGIRWPSISSTSSLRW